MGNINPYLFLLTLPFVIISYAYADTIIYLIPENGHPASSHWRVNYTHALTNASMSEYHHGLGGKVFNIKNNTAVTIYTADSDKPSGWYFIFSDNTFQKTFNAINATYTFYYKSVISMPPPTHNGSGVIGTQYFVNVFKNHSTKEIQGILGDYSSKLNATFSYTVYNMISNWNARGNVTLYKYNTAGIVYVGEAIKDKFLVTLYDGKSLYTFILDADAENPLDIIYQFNGIATNLLAVMFGKNTVVYGIALFGILLIGIDIYYSTYLGSMLSVVVLILMTTFNPVLHEYYGRDFPIIHLSVASLSLAVIIASKYIRDT